VQVAATKLQRDNDVHPTGIRKLDRRSVKRRACAVDEPDTSVRTIQLWHDVNMVLPRFGGG
jgi:hypothetical protein